MHNTNVISINDDTKYKKLLKKKMLGDGGLGWKSLRLRSRIFLISTIPYRSYPAKSLNAQVYYYYKREYNNNR